jgi:antirestriction protein
MEDTPRVYVADLTDYNNALLRGEWIDCDQDADDILEAIKEMLKESSDGVDEDGDPVHEEWAIHDYENFGSIKLSEYEDIEKVADWAKGIAEHGEAYAIWASNDSCNTDPSGFEEQYKGVFNDVEDYAYDLIQDCGYFTKDTPEVLKNYFDYKAFARDMELGGDIWTERGSEGVHVFSS